MGHHLGLSQSRNGKGKQAEQGGQHDTSHRWTFPQTKKQ
jgi:hypothetical protein